MNIFLLLEQTAYSGYQWKLKSIYDENIHIQTRLQNCGSAYYLRLICPSIRASVCPSACSSTPPNGRKSL